MDVIEYFFKTLEKEGLYKGRIEFGNKEYTFFISDGISKINVKEREVPAEAKQLTIERAPAAVTDDRSFYVSKTGEKIKRSSSFKFLFFILIFVAIIVLLVVGIPYLNQTSTNGNQDESSWIMAKKVNTIEAYRGYLAEFPNGKYSLESRNRIEQFLGRDGNDEDFQHYYSQANDFFERGEFDKAIAAVTKAKNIKNNEQVIELENKINEKIANQSKDEKFNIYFSLAQESFNKEDYELAAQNISLAKEIKDTEQVNDLEQKINERIIALNREKEFQNYLSLAQAALDRDQMQAANENLIQAKKIKIDQQTSQLENKIKVRESELKQKQDEAKRDDIYNRYFNFARNYYNEKKYSEALEQIRKAKKIKQTPEVINFENQIQLKIKESQKISQAQIKEDNYNGFFNAARRDFNDGKYDQAMDNIKKARNIKSTAELDSLEKEILRIKKGLENEKTRIEKEKLQKQKEDEYNKYKTRAEMFYRKKEYNKALYNVNRAKEIINSSEIRALEKNILNKRNQTAEVKRVKLMSLPPSMINSYNAAIKKIDVVKLPVGVKALGQISLSLSITQNGNLNIETLNDSRLQTIPPRARRLVVTRIARTINAIMLSPPINRNGEPVHVENWRISYNVGTFMGKIILRRKF